MKFPISRLSFDRAKRVGKIVHPAIKSAHLAEMLAAGFGFRTKAAFDARLRDLDYALDLEWSEGAADQRAKEIDSPRLGPGFPMRPELMTLGALEYIDAWDLERIAHLARQAREERDSLRAPGGNLAGLVEREAALTAVGAWPPPLSRALATRVSALSPAQLFELQAVMWLEREQYGTAWRWQPMLEHARRTHDDGSYDYVLGKGGLGESLLTGLDMLTRRFVSERRPH